MIATILISAVLLVIVGLILRGMLLKARAGQSVTCDGGCPLGGMCQAKKTPPIGSVITLESLKASSTRRSAQPSNGA